MSVNYEDERFKQVENEKNTKLTEVNNTYNGMINNADSYYQAQIDATKDYAKTQQELQQKNTDLAIEQINQQKEKAEKDYTKEQKASYVDYQKAINNYGVNAEKMATSGLSNTGYSESSKVNMFNAYQNRYAVAKESYNLAIQNYNNEINKAMLANNSALAEIAYKALEAQLKLSLEGFQYKNTLVTAKMDAVNNVENTYYGRYKDVVNQINYENEQAEAIRQYNENLALQKAKLEEEKRQYNENLALQNAKFEEEKRQYNDSMALQRTQTSSSRSGSGSSSSSSYSTEQLVDGGKTYQVNTPYYQGDLNSDVKKFGAFSNGYQPKGISGHGTLKASVDKKTGKKNTLTFSTTTLDGKTSTVEQTIWKAEDGTTWYWEGRENRYIQINLK